MNNYSKTIASLLHYNDVIRGTLEYAIRKDTYDKKFYDLRKREVKAEIENQTPLKVCLDNSGEQGEKVVAQINEFYDSIYADDSTIVKDREEGVSVDHAQNVTVLEQIVNLHETINDIVNAHVQGAVNAQQFEPDVLAQVLRVDELYYRGFAFRLLLDELDFLFAEFNKAMQETKGQPSPQSNFIQNDLTKVVNLLGLTRQRSRITSTDYYEVVDPLFALVEMTSGRRDLPAGKNFGQVITECKKNLIDHLVRWENEWKGCYIPFMNQFIEEARAQAQTQQAA
ncbi:MAG: hypothetical protein MJ248_02825 [Bacilli bacterium]|nr:hypothetical protein [Bacilli bacterium]